MVKIIYTEKELLALKGKRMAIFGAGYFGQALGVRLQMMNMQPEELLVSNIEGNPKIVQGIPIRSLQQIEKKEDLLIIIGVDNCSVVDIKNLLLGKGFNNIIIIENLYEFLGGLTVQTQKGLPKIEVTGVIGCHINCKYCPQKLLIHEYYKNNKRRQREISLSNYKMCVDHLPENATLSFAGYVEPFHHPEVVEMLLYAHHTGHRVELFTTFDGCSLDQYEKIKDIPFSRVVLHTPDANGYANINTSAEYWTIIDKALSHRKPGGLPFIDTANCQSVPSKDFLKVANGRVKVISALENRAGNLKDDNIVGVEEIYKYPIRCNKSLNQNHWVLLPDGTLTICCEDFGLTSNIGNLITSTYDDILKNGEYIRIRQAMEEFSSETNLICRKCIHARKVLNYDGGKV